MISIRESPGYIIAKEKGWKSLITKHRNHATMGPKGSGVIDSSLFAPGMMSKFTKNKISRDIENWTGDRKALAKQVISFEDIDSVVILSKNNLKAIASINIDDKIVYISRLATKEPGYGKQIMDQIFSIAKKENKGIELMSIPEARGFYEKLGMHESLKIREKGKFSLSANEILLKSLSEELFKLEPSNGIFCNKDIDVIKIFVDNDIVEKGGVGSGIRGHVTQNQMHPLTPGTKLPQHIQNLRIPPAWTNVTFNSNPDGALLVKGFDSKNKPQSIYSEKFTKENTDKKFARINELMKKEESIQKENEVNLKTNQNESAAIMQLIMHTGIRPGSDKDTGAKVKAYGATTLEGRHVKIDGNEVRLDFVGKKGVNLSIPVTDKAIAISLLKRAKSSGSTGKLFNITEKQLLDYSHSLDGGSFKTKDFRTLLGTKTALKMVNEIKSIPKTMKEYKKIVKDIAIAVAKKLGNTPTVALQSYINPTVFSKLQGAF